MKFLMFSTLLLIYFSYGIDRCDSKKQSPDTDSAKMGDTIDLSLNEHVTFKAQNLEITFATLNDSRCPTGVNCIHAGKASVSLMLIKDENEQILNLESKGLCQEDDGSCGSAGAALGYNVKVINVYPYPTEPKPKEPQTKYVKIVVTK